MKSCRRTAEPTELQLFGGELTRRAMPEQELAKALIESAIRDLAQRETCYRYQLAHAWVVGRYPCGCQYEGTDFTIDAIAAVLDIEATDLRNRVLAEASVKYLSAVAVPVCEVSTR